MANVTAHPFKYCHAVSPQCPVEATTLGYYPNRGINIFFAVGYGLATLALVAVLVAGGRCVLRKVPVPRRTWAYSCCIAAGAALELAGYAARIALHANPWQQQAFETQICAIILAPTLVCIGIYLTLQHICLAVCPGLSRVRPTLYPWIFVPADVSCLLVQAAGGAIAASAGYTNTALLNAGNHLIIAGIVLQVVVLGVFGLAAADYYVRVTRWMVGSISTSTSNNETLGPPSPAVVALWNDRHFRTYGVAVAVAYVCILVRCIYRIAEMAGGWGNPIMQDEPSFIVLEGFMVLIAVGILAGFQPAFLFPQMAEGRKQRKAEAAADATAPATTTTAASNTGNEKETGQTLV